MVHFHFKLTKYAPKYEFFLWDLLTSFGSGAIMKPKSHHGLLTGQEGICFI